MTAQLKRRSLIFGAGLLLYLCALGVSSQVELSDAVRFVWFLIAYLIIGFDSFRGLRDRFMKKQFLTEYTLMVLATAGAFGIERYEEGVLVMILFELGLIFEAFSTDTAKRSIAEMIDIRPPYATRKVKGKEQQVERRGGLLTNFRIKAQSYHYHQTGRKNTGRCRHHERDNDHRHKGGDRRVCSGQRGTGGPDLQRLHQSAGRDRGPGFQGL